jgi:hypothetical protein
MTKLELQIDEQLLDRVQAIATSYGCTVPELLIGILNIMAKPEVLHNPILGMFADEPEAMEQILSEIARDRGWTIAQLTNC